jgi:mono/diheme cytochrome c family protein
MQCQSTVNLQNFCTAIGILIALVNSGIGQAPVRAPVSGSNPALEIARKTYKSLCADCHGDDGRGMEYRESGIGIPDFASKPWFQNKSNSQLKLGILLGKGEEMPPFEDELSVEQANRLVELLRSFAGLSASAVPPKFTDSNKALQKEIEQFQKKWEQLADRWELEFSSLKELADKRPKPKLIR